MSHFAHRVGAYMPEHQRKPGPCRRPVDLTGRLTAPVFESARFRRMRGSSGWLSLQLIEAWLTLRQSEAQGRSSAPGRAEP